MNGMLALIALFGLMFVHSAGAEPDACHNLRNGIVIKEQWGPSVGEKLDRLQGIDCVTTHVPGMSEVRWPPATNSQQNFGRRSDHGRWHYPASNEANGL